MNIHELKEETFQRAATAASDQLEFFSLASVPTDEDCTPAGSDHDLQKIECSAYIRQLVRTIGPPPAGAEFFILENFHDFGTYYEAGIWYIPESEDEQGHDIESASYEYALKCEQGPEYWDEQAKKELIQSGYFKYTGAKVIQMKGKVA